MILTYTEDNGTKGFQAFWALHQRIVLLEQIARIVDDPRAVSTLTKRRFIDSAMVDPHTTSLIAGKIAQVLMGKLKKIKLSSSGLFYSCEVSPFNSKNQAVIKEGIVGSKQALEKHADFVTVASTVLSGEKD